VGKLSDVHNAFKKQLKNYTLGLCFVQCIGAGSVEK
jgi:hypothetical protein